MFAQDGEERRVSTTRVGRPAEEETRRFDEVVGEPARPQEGFMNHPGYGAPRFMWRWTKR
jgi:hypothetical protein